MLVALVLGLLLSLLCAFSAIVLGRNWTHAIVAAYGFLAAIGFGLLAAGAGFLALVVAILGGLILGTLQLIGWMLVDVDRDHIPPTDPPTGLARGIAFVLFGGGLCLLVGAAVFAGELSIEGTRLAPATPADVGAILFGSLGDATILMGLTIATSLLGVLLLMQDDEGKS